MTPTENNGSQPGGGRWFATVVTVFMIILALAHVWKRLEHMINSWLDFRPELLLLAVVILVVAGNRRDLLNSVGSAKRIFCSFMAHTCEALCRWFQRHAILRPVAKAKNLREAACRCAEQLDFMKAIQTLTKARRLLESVPNQLAVAAEFRECLQEISALDRLLECWERLRIPTEVNYRDQLAIICNMCKEVLPHGRHEHNLLYGIWCAQILKQVGNHVIALDVPPDANRWTTASTVTAYLGRLGAERTANSHEDRELTKVVKETLSTWQRQPQSLPWLFQQALAGAQRELQ